MLRSAFLVLCVGAIYSNQLSDAEQKTGVDTGGGFFNLGQKKKLKDISAKLENSVLKSKVDVLGEVLKKHIDSLRNAEKSQKLEMVFLVDASSSVGEENFDSELKFVKKLLADFTISSNHTRVAIVTFSSIGQVVKEIDQISKPSHGHHKCSILQHSVQYTGGGTYTLGSMLEAQTIFTHSRPSARKVLFLITDGFSNGGDPRRVASELRADGVTIFTFGIKNGNTEELFEMASKPGEEHSYILESFAEFVALARRALHRDLAVGIYVEVSNSSLCPEKCGYGATCACGLRTGQYACLCPSGYYGLGTADQQHPCLPCPNGTYHDGNAPGDVTMCTPCPDVNHMTNVPATGLKDCVCKSGFTANGTTCQMVRCPRLKAPEHGYFVRNSCNNVVNAACGMRCDFGYSLVGSSVRLCQQDGTWSGSPAKCRVKQCSRPQALLNGSVSCIPHRFKHEDFPVDTECHFSCQSGNYLVGSKLRTCLPLARWDGLPASCKPILCRTLPKITNGYWEPEHCMERKKQSYGRQCLTKCLPGYELKGPKSRECGGKGTWTNRKESIKCIDVTPPIIECPDNIKTYTDSGTSYATVEWNVPEPQDNSNMSVLIWTRPATDLPMKVRLGVTNLSYVATDTSYNQAVCYFSITVIDGEPPVVEDCESPPAFFKSTNENIEIKWDEPQFHDNSVESVDVKKSHEFGKFPVGTTQVTYIATDHAGNSASCVIDITVKEEEECSDIPAHTIVNCTKGLCSVKCDKGYEFAVPNDLFDGKYPCKNLTDIVPDCSETELPNYISQEGTLTLDPAPPYVCSDMNLLNQMSSELLNKLQDVCKESDEEACEVNDKAVSAECENIRSALEEGTNKLITKRRRREASHHKLHLHFTLVGKTELKYAQHRLSSMAKENTLFKNTVSEKPFSLDMKPVKVICPPTTVRRKHKCVKCPAGTYWNDEKLLCSPCPLGTYQPLTGQRECLTCPLHTSTRKLHSRRIHQCKAICPPGTYSTAKGHKIVGRVGVKPCSSCLIGWYQPQAGSMSCLQCEVNKTTQTRGSVSARQCLSYEDEMSPCHSSPCKNSGICQHSNGLVTCVCPPGYLGSYCENMINECDSLPCIHGGMCIQNGTKHICTCPDGYAGTDCQDDIDECESSPCLNGGECIDLVASYHCHCPSTHQGDVCEENVDDCVDNPCGDGNTCIDGLGVYNCSCREGYSGKYCEIDPCRNASICQNNGTCYLHNNITQPSFWCECLPTFKGTHCETASVMNHTCDSSPCNNNGTCVQKPGTLEFYCICAQGYVGITCDSVSNLNFSLHFVASSTTNYVRLQGPLKPLNQVSVCLWMKTHDRLNYGTVFSYATPDYDNSLTLTDYNGLVIYVNGEHVVTDVTANDGVWHHICIEWITDHGQWALYKDGILSDGGFGLANNTLIPGGGMLILGQDQDRVGGGFSASESLIGHLTQVDFWDYNLGTDEINSLATLCGMHSIGNLINWGQFYFGIHGRIRIRETTLCRGCKTLSPPPFTNITIIESENVAVYTCEPGYTIQQDFLEVTTLRRKCLVHGNWEGPTPTCERRSCGFPGYVTLGSIIGQSYLYGDKVKYKCHPGYHLVGTTTRQCQADGIWSGITPSCQGGDCPDLLQPEHGTMWLLTSIHSESSSYRMEFECKRGYELSGNSILTCLPNNTWDSELPVCKPVMCLAPSKLLHTTFELVNGSEYILTNETKFPVGTEIRYACEIGFKVETQGGTLFCEDTGHWHAKNNNSITACSKIPTCPPPEDVPNGNLSYSPSLLPGTTISLVCNIGFKMKGNDIQVCMENGTWSDDLGICEHVICHSIKTSHLQMPESNPGQSVTIRCPSGYQLTVANEAVEAGEARWQCNEDGNWEEEDGRNTTANIWKCEQNEIIQCSRPEGPPYGYIVFKESNKTTYSEGSFVEIQCRQGYELVGDNRTYCQPDGIWSNSTVCTAVECGTPPLPPSAEIAVLSNKQYGSMAQLKCLLGFRPFGDMSIRCQANKKWSRLRGRCIRLSCGKPMITKGMGLTGNSYLYNESLTVSCPSGTTLIGSKTITCGSDGKWSDLPVCEKQ